MAGRFLTWVKWGCLGLAAGSLVVTLALLWLEGSASLPQSQSGQPGKAQTRVEKPLIVERKGERIIWRLRAEKAEQQLSGRMQLDAPRLEMFADDGEAVSVVGRRAWFDPLTRGIRFENDVRVRYQQWLLQSEALSYVSETDELRVPGHFEVTGETTRARGKGLRIKRQTQRLWVEDGIWIEEADPERWQQEKR